VRVSGVSDVPSWEGNVSVTLLHVWYTCITDTFLEIALALIGGPCLVSRAWGFSPVKVRLRFGKAVCVHLSVEAGQCHLVFDVSVVGLGGA